MKNHWDSNLKVKELVIKHQPKLVVELGAGGGENTEQYLELRKSQPFRMVVISDGECPERFKNKQDFEWRFALSYKELPGFANGSIDFCSVDTDHNYWTLTQELALLAQKMAKGGLVVLHDTETYQHNSGEMPAYNTGDTYPPEIHDQQHKGMVDALLEQIEAGTFKIIKETKESCGATAIIKL